MGEWLITTCRECGDDVPYLPEWDEPQYCQGCRYYETDCEICGESMRIGRAWDNPPKVHKECREKARAEHEERNALWYDGTCRECGGALRICREWDRKPEYCKQCAWYEIECDICDGTLRVHRGCQNPPRAHKDCVHKFRRRDAECVTCRSSFPLSTPLQVKCHKNGWNLPTRCAQCKHDTLLIKAAIGALRDEFRVPLEATVERRGVILSEAVAIVRNKKSGEILAEVTMDKEGVILTNRVAIARSVRSGKEIARTREGTRDLITRDRKAETFSAKTGKRTHTSVSEKKGVIFPIQVTTTKPVHQTRRPVEVRRQPRWFDWLLGRRTFDSD